MSPPVIEPYSILWAALWGAAIYGVCRMALDLHDLVYYFAVRRSVKRSPYRRRHRRFSTSLIFVIAIVVATIFVFWWFILQDVF